MRILYLIASIVALILAVADPDHLRGMVMCVMAVACSAHAKIEQRAYLERIRSKANL
jgi:hypothetical protein